MTSEPVKLSGELRDFVDTAEWTFAKTMPECGLTSIWFETGSTVFSSRLLFAISANTVSRDAFTNVL
jgi:hypothetical protein